MEMTEFGIRLAEIRRQKGLTQEGLAQKLGISAQAVSKWEKGSYPDGALLPKIARCLDTSLDVLYGLKEPEKTEEALEKYIIDELQKLPEETRNQRALQLCYAILCSYNICSADYKDIPKKLVKETIAEVRTDHELLLMRLNEDLQYFLMMQIPEEGLNSYLKIDQGILDLFKMLSQEEYLKVLYYLASGKRNHMLTKKKLVSKLKIDEERISEIIDRLDKLGPVWEIDIETEDRQEKVYGYNHSPAFPMLMAMAKSFTTWVGFKEPGVESWSRGAFREDADHPNENNGLI